MYHSIVPLFFTYSLRRHLVVQTTTGIVCFTVDSMKTHFCTVLLSQRLHGAPRNPTPSRVVPHWFPHRGELNARSLRATSGVVGGRRESTHKNRRGARAVEGGQKKREKKKTYERLKTIISSYSKLKL